MPRPMKGQSLADYMHKFMSSGEAKDDFPKRKQRAAVAYSMFKRTKKKRNAA